MLYKRTETVEAIQLTPRNVKEAVDFCYGKATAPLASNTSLAEVWLLTDGEGCVCVQQSDYIVKDSSGKFFRMHKDEFERTYSPC